MIVVKIEHIHPAILFLYLVKNIQSYRIRGTVICNQQLQVKIGLVKDTTYAVGKIFAGIISGHDN